MYSVIVPFIFVCTNLAVVWFCSFIQCLGCMVAILDKINN